MRSQSNTNEQLIDGLNQPLHRIIEQGQLKDKGKQTEESYRELLEELVEERTAKLRNANEQLQQEITERKQAEETLRKSEERYRTILEIIEEGYFEVDLVGNFTFVNDREASFLGYPKEELIGMNNRQYTDQETSKKLFQVFSKVYITGEPAKKLEMEVIKKDGTKGFIEIWVYLKKDPAGQPTGFRGIARDITERKRAEKALQDSEKRYREVVENATEIIYTVDVKGNFTYGNPAGLKVTGYSLAELQKLNYVDLVLPEHRERVMEMYVKQFREKLSTTYVEFPFFGKRGEIIWFGQNSTLVVESDRIIGFHIIARDITDRKRAEEGLRLLEKAIETLQLGLTITDSHGKIIYTNAAEARMHGYQVEELMGKDVRILAPREIWEPLTGEQLLKMKSWKRESTNIRKDGSTFPVHLLSVVVPNVPGDALGVITTCEDITERKRTEVALIRSEEKYRTILENIDEGYYEVDLAGNFTFANDPKAKILGYFKDELIGMNNRQYTDEETSIKIYKVFNQVYETGKPVKEFDFDVIRKDGSKRSVEISVSLMKNPTGQPTGFRGITRDITERKRAEEALRESEERYRNLVETARDVVFTLSLDGTVVSINPIFEEITGWSRVDWIGKPFSSVVHPDDLPIAIKNFQLVLNGAKNPSIELRILCKSGEYKIGEFRGSVLFRGERAIGYLGIARDITKRKQAEEEITGLQEQLRQAQKMEAVGQLAGGVAHDFNNLLTVIKGYSQLSLNEIKEGDPLRESIEEVRNAADRAADLTRKLLAFSRRQVLEVKVLDLNTVLRDMDKMLHRLIGEDIELVTLPTDDLGRVKTDPGWVEQIIMNLAVNARDAMPKGGKLTIETANVELDEAYAHSHIDVTPGHYVMVSMSDTGVGMSPEVRQRVFEPFFTTKEKGKGMGLGLSIVYGIVKQSGGNIYLYSEPGLGTTFKIYLPRVDESIEEVREKVTGEELSRRGETILLVEDEESVRRLSVEILKRQGYEVLEASCGDDALVLSKEHKEPIHIMLTDVVMPGMSGRELANQLKALHPKMKVLYMSGYTDNAIVNHGVLDEGINYIQKPFTLHGLTKRVRQVLDKDSRPVV